MSTGMSARVTLPGHDHLGPARAVLAEIRELAAPRRREVERVGPDTRIAPAGRAASAGTSSGRNTYVAACSAPVEMPATKMLLRDRRRARRRGREDR